MGQITDSANVRAECDLTLLISAVKSAVAEFGLYIKFTKSLNTEIERILNTFI